MIASESGLQPSSVTLYTMKFTKEELFEAAFRAMLMAADAEEYFDGGRSLIQQVMQDCGFTPDEVRYHLGRILKYGHKASQVTTETMMHDGVLEEYLAWSEEDGRFEQVMENILEKVRQDALVLNSLDQPEILH